ncbi:MAG: alpha/beta hydrolase [Mesorhizobium sp.]
MRRTYLAAMSLSVCMAVPAFADEPMPPLEVPAKSLPGPTADLSAGMQKMAGAQYLPFWTEYWKTGEEARAFADKLAEGSGEALKQLRDRMKVTIARTDMGGARAYTVTPQNLPAEKSDKVVLELHGGCYVLWPGESGTKEATILAGFGGYKVVSVDYRMPPEATFPAALDDAVAVYKELLKTTPAKNIGVFGSSAGGALTLQLVLKLKELGLPVPGAIAPGTPMSDATKVGDSFYTNEKVDNILVSRDGFCNSATLLYAKGHDLKDPLISPIYGDFAGFPPAILITGTRDLLLSNTVRTHRKLRRAGVEAQLEVFEGQSHNQYAFDDSLPETKEAFSAIGAFFDKHLGK